MGLHTEQHDAFYTLPGFMQTSTRKNPGKKKWWHVAGNLERCFNTGCSPQLLLLGLDAAGVGK